MEQKTKVFIAKFHELWGKNQTTKKRSSSSKMREFPQILRRGPKHKNEKKVFISKNARISTNSKVKPQKRVFCKICEKTILAHEFFTVNQYFLESQVSNCTPVTSSLLLSLGHNSRLGVSILVSGAQVVIWEGTVPKCPPVAPGLNHRHTLRQNKCHSTELFKAYWNATETGKHSNVKWNVEKRAQPYQNGSNRCNLCLKEKFAILQANPDNALNHRTEFVSKCRHKAKYKLRNHQPN